MTSAEMTSIIDRIIDQNGGAMTTVTNNCVTYYSHRIMWHDFDGSCHVVRVDNHLSPEDARADAIAAAKRQGWRPPRWYQWWRREDTRP